MTVYVITKALPMREEKFVDVVATKKEADEHIRGLYPNARVEDNWLPGVIQYTCWDSWTRDFVIYSVTKKEISNVKGS